MSIGAGAWLTTDSDQFYIDMALRSADSRYDGKRPRLRVRAAHPADTPPPAFNTPRLSQRTPACVLRSPHPADAPSPLWGIKEGNCNNLQLLFKYPYLPEKLRGGNIQAVSKSRKGLSEANFSQNISGDISKNFENLSSKRIPRVSSLFIHPACPLCRSDAAVAVKAEAPFLHARLLLRLCY